VQTRENTSICLRCGAPVDIDINVIGGSSSSSSSLAAQGEEVEEKLSTCTRVHLVPFEDGLPEGIAGSVLYEEKMDEEYLRDYFADSRVHGFVRPGSRFQINEVDFKVTCCVPGPGRIDANTSVRCMDPPVSAVHQVQKLHVLPCDASWDHEMKYDPQSFFTNVVRPHFSEERHVCTGDVFMSRGVQCRIMAAMPSNGIVDTQTDIFCEGDPVPDLVRIHMLPIYESLPNREKDITPPEIFKKYLEPYFSGRYRCVSHDDTITIDSVNFRVVACEPAKGLITLNTVIFATGDPIKADDLRRFQEEQDAMMARQLQQQEARRMRIPTQAGSISSEELRTRLQTVLRDMPAGDRHREVVQNLHDQLVMLPYNMPHVALQGLQIGQQAPPPNAGGSRSEIENLPTRIYKCSSSEAERPKDQVTCMVCLSEYEEGEVLRTLPCFHSYHQGCIDIWLQRNKTCPVCKNSIS